MKILVVEDDPDIASLLQRNFASEGMETVHAVSGGEALAAVRHNIFSAVVLDVMLPDMTGLEICQLLRKQDYGASIIMLSARDTVSDRIEGLSAGADDYMVKPFAFEELLARIHAQQRRRQGAAQPGADDEQLLAGRLGYWPATREVEMDGKRVALTEREADLMLYLMRNEGRPLSRTDIFDALWQSQGGVAINVVNVYMGYLRRKLAMLDEGARDSIRTVRGKGFMFTRPD